jgi:hypothetical protein
VDEGLAHAGELWRFVLENGRDDYTAEVALLVSNWTDLRASLIATVPAADESATVAALYGQLDGLESCAHDLYEIDLRTLTAPRQVVPDKPLAVLVPGHPPEVVPPSLRRRAVLDAEEITCVGRNLAAIRDTFGSARVELLVLNGDGPVDERVVTWQVSALSREEARLRYYRAVPAAEGLPDPVAVGELVPLHGPDDIGSLFDKGRPVKKVAYIDFTRSTFRDPAVMSAMALDLRRAGCPVLLKGSLLSHFAALLREHSVTVYPILESLDDLPAPTQVAVVPLS